MRECHGDLHLDNIVRRGKRVLMFDCIEFDDALRWIDVACDLSFPLMDLQANGRQDLAARLLNGWLHRTGDFAALPALRYYMVYRALVLARVALLKARKHRHDDGLALAAPYLDLIERIATPRRPYLLLCHGYCGSGKSVASEALVSLTGAVRLSSDVERKRSGPFVAVDLGLCLLRPTRPTPSIRITVCCRSWRNRCWCPTIPRWSTRPFSNACIAPASSDSHRRLACSFFCSISMRARVNSKTACKHVQARVAAS